MNTKHVPDLELCQEFDRLCKEKGIVVPETEFYWNIKNKTLTSKPYRYIHTTKYRNLPAPLVSEQGEFLHKIFLRMKEERIVITDPKGRWNRIVKAVNIMENEANARQKMINYLIAEGIITNL